MTNKYNVISIDIGTSSVKAMVLNSSEILKKDKETYLDTSLNGYKKAIKSVLQRVGTDSVAAICFSSQVGTYVVDDKEIFHWNENENEDYLEKVKKEISQKEFKKEISMPHPNIFSYPLPRALAIKDKFPQAKKVCTLKDYFIEKLTGNYVTDQFSWRGLANLETKEYSRNLLNRFEIEFELPKILDFLSLAGTIREQASKEYGLPMGLPVFVGANDFYCGLLGMGVNEIGKEFNLSGTSEHIGKITKEIDDSAYVSGPYFAGNASYGGTKCSGICCDFAIKELDVNDLSLDIIKENPPIFLPYLSGERTPIFDEKARGVFFGLNSKTNKKMLAYSVFEGVAFGAYDAMPKSCKESKEGLIGAGGSFINDFMTFLKAEVFQKEIIRVEENDVSALGAGLIALVGLGTFNNIKEASDAFVKYKEGIRPNGKYASLLRKRFELYKSLYKDLKTDFEKLNIINGGTK